MPTRAVFERSRRELSLDVSGGVHILLVVQQSSLESQSRGVCQDSDTYGNQVFYSGFRSGKRENVNKVKFNHWLTRYKSAENVTSR